MAEEQRVQRALLVFLDCLEESAHLALLVLLEQTGL